MADQRLPAKVIAVIDDLYASLQQQLPPGTLRSIYIYGSTALGAYVEGTSDIDFVAFLTRSLRSEEIAKVEQVHRNVDSRWLKLDLMGAYIRLEDFGKPAQAGETVTYFARALHTNLRGADLNPITWRVMREAGICAAGEPLELPDCVSDEELLQYVIGNMNTYWQGWIQKLAEWPAEAVETNALEEAVEWCVLGMLRQLYTIRERNITSKPGAGEYGLERLPAQWHGLIQAAIQIKLGESGALPNSSDSTDVRRKLLGLLRHIHKAANADYQAFLLYRQRMSDGS
ncbi:aminoglycoside adenylyltransferase domain-containing protein [Paenibacillus koleovorans]|uniref:aminoglycoside adenylyltransferase domain-containing protein n=1 Tax=Paenibacillus koleovorans TaxID=121608 RepID=UPI000FD6C93A|nr:aminoglycoside adenylyltransferase domain-containing protein [Paenibacillus koleovorans]